METEMMKLLMEESKKIDEGFAGLQSDLLNQRAETLKKIDLETENLKKASAMGDRSENAAFTDAVDELKRLRVTLSNIDLQIKSMGSREVGKKYVPIGMIVLYSTFVLQDNYGEKFIFKMCPENVSDLDRKMLAKNSPIGKMLWLKEKGDQVKLEHGRTGEMITYTVLEVY